MKRLTVLVLASLVSGCVYTSYSGKNGQRLTRISVFGNQTVGKIDLERGTMEGYTSEQAEVAGAAVSAAIKAATGRP